MTTLRRAASSAFTAFALATSAVVVPHAAPAAAQTSQASWEQQLATAQAKLDTARANLDAAEKALHQAQNGTSSPKVDDLEAKKEKLQNEADQPLTQEELRILAGQATMELINDYRTTNGLHPLRVHPIFTEKAEYWNGQMNGFFKAELANGTAIEINGMKIPNESFRHSTNDELPKAGENILYLTMPESPSPQQWGSSAVHAFDAWRNSPGHNGNMVSELYDGAGLAFFPGAEKICLSTTVFHQEYTRLTSKDGRVHHFDEDGTNALAMQSPDKFYMPQGAREALGITAEAPQGIGLVPLWVRNGDHKTWDGETTKPGKADYSEIAGGKATMDRRVNNIPAGGDPNINWGKVKTDKGQQNAELQLAAVDKQIEAAKTQGPNLKQLQDKVDAAKAELEKAQRDYSALRDNKPKGEDPKPNAPTSTQTTTQKPAPSTTQKPAPTTPKTTAPVPGHNGGEKEGLSTGAIVGIVIGVLVLIVGIAAAALPMLGNVQF